MSINIDETLIQKIGKTKDFLVQVDYSTDGSICYQLIASVLTLIRMSRKGISYDAQNFRNELLGRISLK